MVASEMIRYLLDTNIIVYWLRNRDRSLIARAAQFRRVSAIPAIVAHELSFGAFNGERPEQTLAEHEAIGLPVLPFDADDAREAGRIRAAMRRAGTPIGPYDLLIAGQALARDLILVTNNVGEFSRIAGLRLENWATA